MRAFASKICSEFKQIELNWNRIVHQNALWSLVFSTTRPWNKQISATDASQPSSQERWQVADLKHLKISYIFSLPRISSKDFPYIKGKIDRSIGSNYSSVNFKWTQVFRCYQSFDRRQDFPRVAGSGWRVRGSGWRVTGGGWRVKNIYENKIL